jgi:hypothetical protein
LLVRGERSLYIWLRRDRQHVQLIQRFKSRRTLNRRALNQRDRIGRRRIGRERQDSRRGRGRQHRLSQQAKKCDALFFGNEVRAIQDGIGEPGEELDQRSSGIARLR